MTRSPLIEAALIWRRKGARVAYKLGMSCTPVPSGCRHERCANARVACTRWYRRRENTDA